MQLTAKIKNQPKIDSTIEAIEESEQGNMWEGCLYLRSTGKYHFSPTRTIKIKQWTLSKYGKDREPLKLSQIPYWHIKFMITLGTHITLAFSCPVVQQFHS